MKYFTQFDFTRFESGDLGKESISQYRVFHVNTRRN